MRSDKLKKMIGDLLSWTKRDKLFILTILLLLIWIIIGFIAYQIEIKGSHATIRNFWDGFYWAIVTFTTTGYGDMTPQTTGGKILALSLMISSLVLLAIFTAMIASRLVERRIKEGMGLKTIKEKGHIIICGWNYFGGEVLKRLNASSSSASKRTVVLVNELEDDIIENIVAEYDNLNLHYVKGDFTREGALKRASGEHADSIMILADRSGSRTYDRADERTILGALTIKSLNPKVQITAELLSHHNSEHAKRAGINEVVLRGSHSGSVLANAVTAPGLIRVIELLLSTEGPMLWKVSIPKRFVGKTVSELTEHYQKKKALLVSIITEEKGISLEDILSDDMSAIDMFIKRKFEESEKEFFSVRTKVNPEPDYVISQHDSAVVIAREDPGS